ncbi:Uma2 family endonuclease [Leptothoe sp. LEGE 181152]|nr:Uma2 family endonuclease [Leptothoe sp. LEGE 181152]
MTQAKESPELLQPVPPVPPSESLPTMYDLPSEFPEEPGLPDEFHDLQPQLLSRTLRLTQYAADNYFTGTDINLYYDVRNPLWHKRPDWFLAVDVPRLYGGKDLRNSYVVWQEGVSPLVVVEFLSPGTEAEDLGPFYRDGEALETVNGQQTNGQPSPPRKWQVYEQILRVPYYVVFSRYTGVVRFFRLVGARYEEQLLQDAQQQIWMPELDLGLGIWSGIFEGIDHNWLRWCDAEGNWLLTDTELAAQRADEAMERADEAEARLRQVVRNLRQSGMDTAAIAGVVGLSVEDIDSMDNNLV